LTTRMTYNFRLLWRLTIRSFFESENTYGKLTPKRLKFLFIFYTVWPVYTLMTWFFFILDELIFPDFKKQPIEKPLFILGNFRSGSTFLHRTLSRDSGMFTSLRTVDIFMMPSITQRKLFRFFGRFDRFLGSPVVKAFKNVDRHSLGNVRIHHISMFEPEEDENILLHAWSTFFVSFLFPFLDDLPPYQFFDNALSVEEKKRVMLFYRGCIQRHLFASGKKLHFVSKSPASSAKIESLMEFFPDARILYLVRNPLDMLPSTISWLSYVWNIFSEPGQKYLYRDQVLALTKYWYHHPLEIIDQNPSPNRLIINYDDLVRWPEQVIRTMYERFDYSESPGLEKIIENAMAESRTYRSDHVYHYEEMGFTHQEILREFADIFERFQFDRREAETIPYRESETLPVFSAELPLVGD
jgi:omega-hydroxy-beta-dihydromenaquinone-9 sulfotransferase